MDEECAQPRHSALEHDHKNHPFSAEFAADGRHSCNARRVKQAEHQHRDGCERGKQRHGVEHLKGRYDAFFCHKTTY